MHKYCYNNSYRNITTVNTTSSFSNYQYKFSTNESKTLLQSSNIVSDISKQKTKRGVVFRKLFPAKGTLSVQLNISPITCRLALCTGRFFFNVIYFEGEKSQGKLPPLHCLCRDAGSCGLCLGKTLRRVNEKCLPGGRRWPVRSQRLAAVRSCHLFRP